MCLVLQIYAVIHIKTCVDVQLLIWSVVYMYIWRVVLMYRCTVVVQLYSCAANAFFVHCYFEHLNRILFPNGCRLNVAGNRNMSDFLLRYKHGCLLLKYKSNMTILNSLFNSFTKINLLSCTVLFSGFYWNKCRTTYHC